MAATSVSTIKKAQKESLFFRKISQLFAQTALDDTRLQEVCINRVSLSRDKGVCTVYFYTAEGEARFQELLPILILYKPSLRKALASSIKSRYTPELVFAFDKNFEKHCRLENILEHIKTEEE